MAFFSDYPIKRVKIRNGDIKQNPGGGDGPKVFGEVTNELRHTFSDKVEHIKSELHEHFDKFKDVPAVAKVNLKGDALAKSHRPNNLFSTSTCPIIGGGKSKELFIEVTGNGLDSLQDKILNGSSKQIVANISTLDDISPYEIQENVTEEGNIKDSTYLKVKLFRFQNEETNIKVHRQFEEYLKENNISLVKELHYGKHRAYKLKINSINEYKALKQFVAIKSLNSIMPIHTYTPELNNLPNVPIEIMTPDPNVEYPYVGIVDSGINKGNPFLSQWIEKTEEFVLPQQKNHSHGTFVAGLLVYGDRLIGKTSEYDGVKIVDVCVIPNDDPNLGEVGFINEDDIIEILSEVVPKYSGRVKVWNLSLGSEVYCDDEQISDLGASLDEIQDENDVIFIISSGNYEEEPIRPWPPEEGVSYQDKITIPADSIRGVTVGSISHVASSLSEVDTPSPFSRKGPGPSYTIKPELVDYGGNVEIEPSIQKRGVTSFSEDGSLIQDIGTSFSAPKIASLLSKVFHYFNNDISTNLAKAFVFHSALGLSSNDELYKSYKEYSGFGRPQELSKILSCTNSSSTIVFEGKIHPSTYIEITDFPFPNVLNENGKWYGEVYITLVYNPPLDANYGYEYCRSNIEVSLGTIKPNGKYSREVHFERISPYGYEEDLVKDGLKWSPVKMYKRKISQGIADNPWKLRLDLQGRSNEALEEQDFALIISIKDPEGVKEVYNDVAAQIEQRFTYENLNVNTIRTSLKN